MTNEAAIEYLKLFHGYDLPIQEAFEMAIEALKQNQWIPCEERLPKEKGIYPVWTAKGFGDHLSTSYWDGEEWSLRVIAWMPLPKAYEGRTE